MRKIKIYNGKRTVSVNEKLAELYDTIRPLNTYEIEAQLGITGIFEENTSEMPDEELNEKIEDILIEEIKVIMEINSPEIKAEIKKLRNFKQSLR